MGKTTFDKSASVSCLPASAAANEVKDGVCTQGLRSLWLLPIQLKPCVILSLSGADGRGQSSDTSRAVFQQLSRENGVCSGCLCPYHLSQT